MKQEVIESSILRNLYSPKENSHKGENGILVVIGGSKKYHGAPLLAIKAASRFVDLLYFHSPEKENMKLLQFLKSHKSTFIAVEKKELNKTIEKADCVLIGNGMELNASNKKLVNSLLKKFNKSKKIILDAGALHLVDKKLLNSNICLTPHILEFTALFGKSASSKNAMEMASKYACTILLKHVDGDIITDGTQIAVNQTGNEGMTKGGTGDTLAGLTAALSCKNNLFIAAKASAFLNGFAGDMLKKERGIHFDADDLADNIGIAFKKASE
jgi:NAD(P)H-hydrate epimerase